MLKQQTEIQELKQALLKANEDIEKLSKLKSDFVSIISHELRTPLTSIKESVSLVLDEVAGPLNENQKNFLNMAKNNIDRLAKIILDVLDFSKLDAGRIVMHKRRADINKVINDVYVEMEDEIKKSSLGLDTALSDKIEATWMDTKRITQALRHLIDNAIKFNKENGRIKVSSVQESVDGKELIKVSVEDTGISIPKEDLAKIFNNFTPLDTSMTRKHKGVGIGLSICKKIIDYHGGDIWVESEKGVGSKFIFTLPIYKKDDEFNFLLDESIERAKYGDMELSLIFFMIKDSRKKNEANLARLEEIAQSVVRGPEDKVTRFREGNVIAMMAGTNRYGSEKIICRFTRKCKFSIYYGIAVYPDDADSKGQVIEKAERELDSRKFIL